MLVGSMVEPLTYGIVNAPFRRLVYTALHVLVVILHAMLCYRIFGNLWKHDAGFLSNLLKEAKAVILIRLKVTLSNCRTNYFSRICDVSFWLRNARSGLSSTLFPSSFVTLDPPKMA